MEKENFEDIVNILLVDDRVENLIALESVLSSPHYRLFKAKSGTEALRFLLHYEFALILLDVQMPEMDGFETAKVIRSREQFADIPIIFLSAVYQDLHHMNLGYETGAVDYLLKPIETDILRSKVRVFSDLFIKTKRLVKQAEVIAHEKDLRNRAQLVQKYYHRLIDKLDHSIIWEAEAPTMKFLFVSSRAVDLLGFPHEQWFEEENFFWNHVHPKDRDFIKELFNRSYQDRQQYRCEHRMIASDGTVYWYHTGVQVESTDFHGKSTFKGLTVDITPFKFEEEKLRKSESKFRRAVESNLLGNVFGDLNGNIKEANECFLQMTGYTQEDIGSGRVTWGALLSSQSQLGDERAIQDLLELGSWGPFEKELLRKDGSKMVALVGSTFIEESSEGVMSFVMDLTERKQSEQKKLGQLRNKEELLEIVSHDLKNPLSAILMNVALMYRKVATQPESNVLIKQLNGIQRSAERMKRLIEDLLDLTKVESGKLVLERKSYSVNELLDELVDMLHSAAEQKNLKIEKNVQDSTLTFEVDHDRLFQVLSNLLGNAIKFSPPHSLIRISAESNGPDVLLSIVDQGPGIPEENLRQLFDRYWQAGETAHAGTGLGLAIAKGIVDSHGGKIWAESVLGKGSSFYCLIPKNSRSLAQSQGKKTFPSQPANA